MLTVTGWSAPPALVSGSGAQLATAPSEKMHAAHVAETADLRSASLAAVGTLALNAVSSASVHLPVCGAAGFCQGRVLAGIAAAVGQVPLDPEEPDEPDDPE